MFETAASYIVGPLLVAILAWAANRKLNKTKVNTEETHATAKLLHSQREDFDLLLEPMRGEIARLRTRMCEVEQLLRREKRVTFYAIAFIRTQQIVIRRHAPEHTPDIPDELTDYI